MNKRNLLSKALICFALLLIPLGLLKSQDNLRLAQLETGKSYKVVLYNETEITGILKFADYGSISIVKPNGSVVVIPRDQIYYVTQDETPLKYKASFAVLGGALFITNKSFGNLNYWSLKGESGPHVTISGTWFLTDHKALMFDAEYSHNDPDFSGFYKTYPNPDAAHINSLTGGSKSFYSFKCDLLYGNFGTKDNVMYGVYMGLGVHVMDQRMIYMNYYTHYNGDTTFNKYVETYPETIEIGAVLSIGGTVNFQISKHYGIRTDLEFNLTSSKGDLLFTGGRNYLPLRIGAYYIF